MKIIIGITAALLLVFTLCAAFTACRDAQEKVLFKIGDYPVTVEEYTYFYRNYQTQLSASGDADRDAIHENVLLALRHKYAIQSEAERYGIELTEEDERALETLYDNYVAQYGGKEAFAAALTARSMTDRYFRSALRATKLEELTRAHALSYLSDIRADDATVLEDIPKNFIRASQILILHETGDDLVRNYELACSLAERAQNGEDFEALVREYNEDTYMDPHDGYYFTRGERLEEFEKAAWALEEGQVSDVVTSDLGYHVICRLPMEETYIKAHMEDLIRAYRARVFNERIADIAASFEIKYYDRFYELNLQ